MIYSQVYKINVYALNLMAAWIQGVGLIPDTDLKDNC